MAAAEEAEEAALLEKYPGRQAQARALCRLLASATQPLPPALHLQDTCTGKATAHLLTDVLGLARRRAKGALSTITLDPLTCPTAQLLWSSLLRAVSSGDGPVADESSSGPSGRQHDSLSDDSIDAFTHRFHQVIKAKARASSSTAPDGASVVIVIKRAERTRDLWPEPVIEALYSLGELCDLVGRVCIITTSHLGVSHFRSSRPAAARRGPVGAITIPFGRLTKREFIDDSMRCAEVVLGKHAYGTISRDDMRNLFHRYLSIAYDAFAADVRDCEEMRLLACCVWHPFIVPLLNGSVGTAALQPLLVRSPGLFQDALDNLLTRKVTPEEWIARTCAERSVPAESKPVLEGGEAVEAVGALWILLTPAPTIAPSTARSRSIPVLPPATAYLVLASFLASYNPARLDVRYFVRNESALLVQAHSAEHGAKRRRRKRGGALYKKPHRKARKQRHGADGESSLVLNRQALLGPRPFTYDRLLSIFQALVTEAGLYTRDKDTSTLWELKSKSVAVTDAVNRLLRSGLLVRTSLTERLDVTMTLRTNVTYETVVDISKQIHFDLQDWLWDWT